MLPVSTIQNEDGSSCHCALSSIQCFLTMLGVGQVLERKKETHCLQDVAESTSLLVNWLIFSYAVVKAGSFQVPQGNYGEVTLQTLKQIFSPTASDQDLAALKHEQLQYLY